MTLVGREHLDVEISSGAVGRFRLIDIEGPAGKLQLLDNDPAFAGAAYGGARYGGYGGARYGGYGGARYGGLRRPPRPRPRP
jgi:hypothetical protein